MFIGLGQDVTGRGRVSSLDTERKKKVNIHPWRLHQHPSPLPYSDYLFCDLRHHSHRAYFSIHGALIDASDSVIVRRCSPRSQRRQRLSLKPLSILTVHQRENIMCLSHFVFSR
ncbi:hypothetical protein U1Q18_037636 [Sarracenia purpurea var. burkii]